jgi:hypothetical protein
VGVCRAATLLICSVVDNLEEGSQKCVALHGKITKSNTRQTCAYKTIKPF